MIIKGNVASEGIVVGKLQTLCVDYESAIKNYQPGAVSKEKERYAEAQAKAKSEIELILDNTTLTDEEKGILEAHLLMVDDIMWEEMVMTYLEGGNAATDAILSTVKDMRTLYDEIDDAYLKERQKDIVDVGNRLLRKLLGIEEQTLSGDGLVLWADDIAPSVMAGLKEGQVKAVLLESGSQTSHTVIIAKSKGFTVLVGVTLPKEQVTDGDTVIVDGEDGIVILNPDEEQIQEYSKREKAFADEQAYYKSRCQFDTCTLDGKDVTVAANISGPQDMESALEHGAVGVGLYRTEFLFMGEQLPSEEEQTQSYESVIKQATTSEQALCVIRTLDIGGDKKSACLGLEQEDNPFLGFRAIRICLQKTDVFKTQIKAILRAALQGKTAIMLPMITSQTEIAEAKALIEEAKAELEAEGKAYADDVLIGIMVETPAAVWMAPVFAKYVDFFSIGTNDLVQYTLAVDRGNQSVSYLYDYMNPAVLQEIAMVAKAAQEAGIWVGMCGEMAGDELALPFLLSVGIDELSMSASQIPRVKERIRSLPCDGVDLTHLLSLEDAMTVREYLKSIIHGDVL